MHIISTSFTEDNLCAFAARLAPLLHAGDCLLFYGDLGAGKTTFIRAMIQTLAGVQHVPSPTFTLVQTYDAHGLTLWHFDLYRLEKPEDLYELGFEDALTDGVAFIEWPEHAKDLLPRAALQLHFASVSNDAERHLIIKGNGQWEARLTPITS
jgi:tRNA threonylcarbamoyladenosine biosynthesis protein TsaE